MGTTCEGTQVFAARGLDVNRSLKLSVVGYRERVSFPPAPYRGQKPADGFRCTIITIQSSPPPPLSCKSKYGVVESLLPAQSNPVFTENPKAGPTSECSTLHSPSPSEPLLCHLQNGSCNVEEKAQSSVQCFNRISELEGWEWNGVILSRPLPETKCFLKYPGRSVFEHPDDWQFTIIRVPTMCQALCMHVLV